MVSCTALYLLSYQTLTIRDRGMFIVFDLLTRSCPCFFVGPLKIIFIFPHRSVFPSHVSASYTRIIFTNIFRLYTPWYGRNLAEVFFASSRRVSHGPESVTRFNEMWNDAELWTDVQNGASVMIITHTIPDKRSVKRK